MADGLKITELASLAGATLAANDAIPVVDVSDTSMAPSGTNKKMTPTEFAIGIATLGSLATDAELAALEATLADIATSGSASDLDSGTVPTARLGSGDANAGSFLRGNQTWSTPPSPLDAGLGSNLPWAQAPFIGPELWAVANFTATGGGTNTTQLDPSLTANGTTLTKKTSISIGIPANLSCYRFSGNITSVPVSGTVSVSVSFVTSGGTLIGSTVKQRISNPAGTPLGYFEVEFRAVDMTNGAYFRLDLDVANNAPSGDLTITDISLRKIAHIVRPMYYADAGSGTNARVWTPLFDPVAQNWKWAEQNLNGEGDMDRSLLNITGYSDDPFRYPLPDPGATNPDTTSTNSGLGGTDILLGAGEFSRSLRIGNNDQIIDVLNGSSAYELRGNTHDGEFNTVTATFDVDRGDGTWIPWAATETKLHPARRFRMTWPTTMELSTNPGVPFANVDHVTTWFNDGVIRTDRTTTFLSNQRLRLHFEWMTSHSTATPKLGRIGRGLVVLDEVDVYNKLAAPASPGASTNTSGGFLAAATYGYVVTTLTEMGESTPTAMVTQVTTGTTSVNTITWSAVSGATGYRVYGRSSTLGVGRMCLLATIPVGTETWDDDGTAVAVPGQFSPDVNTARSDTGATNSQDAAVSQQANWAAWYDIPLNMVYANIFDRDAIAERAEVLSTQTQLVMGSGICKNYILTYFVGDGTTSLNLNTQPVTSATEWSATHWNMVYCPADRVNWHNEVALRSMDLPKLKELYPAT